VTTLAPKSLILFATVLLGPGPALAKTGRPTAAHADHGVRFSCSPHEIPPIKAAMAGYLRSLGISDDLVSLSHSRDKGVLVYRLALPRRDASTLDLASHPGLGISPEPVQLRIDSRTTTVVETVSQKEIVLALLHPGRLTELRGPDCSMEVFIRHVALRQNIVAWAEKLRWRWPDGGPAAWNDAYWDRGTPRPGVSVGDAIDDVFANQRAYTIGCYTATKLVMVKGVLDYYGRAQDLPGMSTLVEARLLSDGEPLVDVEPGIVWSFEPDFDPKEAARPGKIASIVHDVAPRNFVPGDWVYLINSDPVTRQKIGHEGSNAIYLGGGRFDDYYGDNNHAFTYVEKLDEVFQWRNGVFDLKRDAALRRPLTAADFDRLSLPPEQGGLVHRWRITPAFFGAETRTLAAKGRESKPEGESPAAAPVLGLSDSMVPMER
jgi:hypothetical protein